MKDRQYLTEERLKNFVFEIFKNTEIIHNRKLFNVRPDFYLPEFKLIIEFDGYFHFSKSKTIIRDLTLDKTAKRTEIKVIHIPYFIQLDIKTYNILFSDYIKLEDKTLNLLKNYKYPHGFINEKALLPADFCNLGIKRFEYFLNLFSPIKNEIINSLNNKIILNNKNIHEVYPINYFLKWNS